MNPEIGDGWWKALVDTTQDAVVAIGDGGRIVLFNRAAERMFGWTASEVLGERVNRLMAEPYATEHDRYISHYEETGEKRAIGRIRSVSACRKSGETFSIELSVTELPGVDGVRYAALIRDISDTVRLQQDLLDRERLAAVGMASAKFAHEVGNPLNSIYMHVQLMQRRLAKQADGGDPRLHEQLVTIGQEIARLEHLLAEFRSLARKRRYDRAPTDLAVIVRQVCMAQQAAHAAQGIRVHEHIEPIPAVVADAEKITQVLLNMCKNAAEAMLQGGEIFVSLEPAEPGWVRIRIADTGRGIAPDIDVFEPFVTTKPEGTGLGLPICKQIVLEHGGRLRHEPHRPAGTVFTIELPVDGRLRARSGSPE